MGNYAETIGDTVFAQDLYQTVVLYNCPIHDVDRIGDSSDD